MSHADTETEFRLEIPAMHGKRHNRPADILRAALPVGALLIAGCAAISCVQTVLSHDVATIFACGLSAVAIGLWNVRGGDMTTKILLSGAWFLTGLCTFLIGLSAISDWSVALPLGCMAAVIQLPSSAGRGDAIPACGMALAVFCFFLGYNGKDRRHGE